MNKVLLWYCPWKKWCCHVVLALLLLAKESSTNFVFGLPTSLIRRHLTGDQISTPASWTNVSYVIPLFYGWSVASYVMKGEEYACTERKKSYIGSKGCMFFICLSSSTQLPLHLRFTLLITSLTSLHYCMDWTENLTPDHAFFIEEDCFK